MSEIRNYIFDFDGTLMDTQGVIMATIRQTISDMQLPPRTDAECKTIIGVRTVEAAAVLYPELPDMNAEFAQVFRRNYDELKKNADTKLFDHVMSTLSQLRADGHGMAIASSRRRASILDYLGGLGITDWFEMIVGADDVTCGKPSPEPVLKVLDTLLWDADATLVVGDAAVDILMGNAAGCRTCAVTYGNGSLADLKAACPTYMIDRFDQLLVIE